MAKRILAFMAHPDDVEFSCAGTLARLQEEAGCEIIIATATSGDCGTMDYRPDEIARIRHQEALNAAKLMNAEYRCAGSTDLMVAYDPPTLRRFTEVVRKSRPDVIITHPPVDYLIDHEMVSKLVRTSAFSAPAPNFLTFDIDPAPRIDHIPHLYYAMPVEGVDWYGRPVEPGFLVDISAKITLKEKMLASHVSQREWLRKHHGMDEYIEAMRRSGADQGKRIGKQYAEGFHQHLGHGYPHNNLIAEMLKL